jgi:hypothetical protein
VTFVSEPAGARVVRLSDGRTVCSRTPCPIEVERGTVLRVRAEMDARVPDKRILTVNDDTTVEFKLKPVLPD